MPSTLIRGLKRWHWGGLLPLITLAASCALVLVGGLITTDPIIAVDVRLANLLVSFRTEPLTQLFSALTLLGKSHVVVLFVSALAILLVLWRKGIDLMALIITIVGSTTSSWLLKLAFQRPRPDQAIYLESSYSFPSGHATIAVALYGFIGYLLIRLTRRWWQRISLVCTTLALIAAIGLSRLYLAEHYLTDVLAGYLLGALWLGVAVASGPGLSRFNALCVAPILAPVPDRQLLTGLVITLALAGYLAVALTYQMPLKGP